MLHGLSLYSLIKLQDSFVYFLDIINFPNIENKFFPIPHLDPLSVRLNTQRREGQGRSLWEISLDL